MVVVVRDDRFIAIKIMQTLFYRKRFFYVLKRVNGLKKHCTDNRQHQYKIDYGKLFPHFLANICDLDFKIVRL